MKKLARREKRDEKVTDRQTKTTTTRGKKSIHKSSYY